MPILFVHGVNQRNNAAYKAKTAATEVLFRTHFASYFGVPCEQVNVIAPYWGDHGARFAWNYTSLSVDAMEGLGAEAGDNELQKIIFDRSPSCLIELAKSSLEAFLDLVWLNSDRDILVAVELHRLTHDSGYRNDARSAASDEDLISITRAHVFSRPDDDSDLESLGVTDLWPKVKAAVEQARVAVASYGSQKLSDLLRGVFRQSLSNFVGDVLIYVSSRGTSSSPGAIPLKVIASVEQAEKTGEPLIAVGHSLGGVVLYDVLSHFRPRTQCDWFITVGSQVSLFEELKLLIESNPDIPRNGSNRACKPPGATKWLNVLDSGDALAFAASGVFEEVDDFEFATGSVFPSSHSQYFALPSFYERLVKRMREVS